MATDTKNFKVSEFACKHCGKGKDIIDQRVINMAQIIRDEVGVPIRVNSGYRCDENNSKVSKVKNSKHTFGQAADLSCSIGALDLYLAIHKLYVLGKLPDLDYCIYYPFKNFCHIDCGGKRSKVFAIDTSR